MRARALLGSIDACEAKRDYDAGTDKPTVRSASPALRLGLGKDARGRPAAGIGTARGPEVRLGRARLCCARAARASAAIAYTRASSSCVKSTPARPRSVGITRVGLLRFTPNQRFKRPGSRRCGTTRSIRRRAPQVNRSAASATAAAPRPSDESSASEQTRRRLCECGRRPRRLLARYKWGDCRVLPGAQGLFEREAPLDGARRAAR